MAAGEHIGLSEFKAGPIFLAPAFDHGAFHEPVKGALRRCAMPSGHP